MKNKDLLYALNEIDSTYISEAKGTKFKNRRRRWIALGIAAACICVVVGAQHFIHQDAPKSNESGNSQGNLPQPGQSLQEVQTGAISADFARQVTRSARLIRVRQSLMAIFHRKEKKIIKQ